MGPGLLDSSLRSRREKALFSALLERRLSTASGGAGWTGATARRPVEEAPFCCKPLRLRNVQKQRNDPAGSMRRSRAVETAPRNGGLPCQAEDKEAGHAPSDTVLHETTR